MFYVTSACDAFYLLAEIMASKQSNLMLAASFTAVPTEAIRKFLISHLVTLRNLFEKLCYFLHNKQIDLLHYVPFLKEIHSLF